jgi:hypothetical protein
MMGWVSKRKQDMPKQSRHMNKLKHINMRDYIEKPKLVNFFVALTSLINRLLLWSLIGTKRRTLTMGEINEIYFQSLGME